jgi:ankyrin repeat protein
MSVRRMVAVCTLAAVLGGICFAASSEVADAAMHKNREAVAALIAKKVDVNAPQTDGATALHWAIYNGDERMVDMLLKAGANPKAANRDGATVLSLACINGDAAMIEKLLAAGANPNETLPNGETPLMLAARTGSIPAMKVLIDHKASVNAKEKLRGTTALMWAASEGHPEAVKFLIANGADINATDAVVQQRGSRPNVAPTAAARAESAGAGASRDRQSKQGKQGPVLRGAAAGRATQGDVTNPDRTSIQNAFSRGADVGEMTPLMFAARQGDMESVKILVEAGADVNKQSVDGWTALNIATQNRYYKIGAYLLDHGANPNLANKQGWSPLYLATDNRNIESGEYPVRVADMDHLEYIKLLLAHKADPNLRAKDYTETRTNFTMQWLNEDGATPFLRAAQSGDVELMKLLLAAGADPKIATKNGTTALMVACGIGWVEGVTYEWSPKESFEAVKMLLDLGLDVNAQDNDGRTAMMGAAHKGRNEVVQALFDHGADLSTEDYGSRDSINGELLGHRWRAVDYADGLVRVGVQSAIPHPETAVLLRKLMKEKGLPDSPPKNETVCLTPDVCK